MIEFIKIRENENIAEQAANWFHQKWGVPLEAYQESIRDCLKKETSVPQWYLAMDHDVIIGGLGVIENDFHNRKDLTPNVCAVYVEEEYRCQGIAGKLLQYVCDDMNEQGIDTLYLVTDHTSFYERYGWEFLCMVQGDGEPEMTRMYIHQKRNSFPAEDGHIESILIGVDQVKVSFQTWDSRKLILIFDNVEKIISLYSVYEDIGRFEVISGSNEFKKYIFYSAWDDENGEEREILSIEAEKMKIFQVGIGAEINSAIFDVGYEYIGNQKCPYC